MDSFTGSFQGFADFRQKHFEGIPLGVCFWCFQYVILIQNSRWKRYLTALLVSIFYQPIFLIFLQNTTKTSVLNDTYLQKSQN